MCIAAIRLEDVAALQLAQPCLGKMAVKEPAQPFCGVTFRGCRLFLVRYSQRIGFVCSFAYSTVRTSESTHERPKCGRGGPIVCT